MKAEGNHLRTIGGLARVSARTRSTVSSSMIVGVSVADIAKLSMSCHGSSAGIGGLPLPGLHISTTRARLGGVQWHNRTGRSARVHARTRVISRWRIYDDAACWTISEPSICTKTFGRDIRMLHDRATVFLPMGVVMQETKFGPSLGLDDIMITR